ncbi:MAG: amidohydrolase family protein [Lachnospiraceae bacterium]|nr:amidohydrolase family protein [Lachnospiraceae bacterium]
MFDKAVINGNVYLEGEWKRTNIYIKKEKIELISESFFEAKDYLDAQSYKVIPGLIDSHVHMYMGNSLQSADDFYSGSVAAAYGGITTLIDFMKEVPTANQIQEQYEIRRKEAENAVIDYSFHPSVCGLADDPEAIREKILSLGLPSMKVYTTYKPNTYSDDESIEKLIGQTADGQVMVLVHSEKDDMLNSTCKDIRCHSKNRPVESEMEQVKIIADMIKKAGGRGYIVHVSAGSTLQMLKEEYASLLKKNLFLESCPHYFLFDDSEYEKPTNIRFTMTPPLRSRKEVEKIRQYIDLIDCMSTDHCPFMLKQKQKPTLEGLMMGVGGVEQSFRQMYKLYGDKIIPKYTIIPAKVHGLYPKKGQIKEGFDADLVLFYESSIEVPLKEHTACDYSIYEGMTSGISIDYVMNRGSLVIEKGKLHKHTGKFLERKL